MNAIYIVGGILIAFGIAVLSQTGSLTSSQMVYYPTVGTILFIIGVVLCYVECTSDKSKPTLDKRKELTDDIHLITKSEDKLQSL